MNNLKIGIVIADQNEFAPFKERALSCDIKNQMEVITLEKGVTCILSGVGLINATMGAVALAEGGADIILSVGLSGGINEVERNETIAGTAFLQHDFDLTPLGYEKGVKPQEKYIFDASETLLSCLKECFPQMKSGVMVSGDCFVCDDGLRQELKDKYGAVACDMETAGVSAVCEKYALPFLAIRKISDDAGSSAKSLYRDAVSKFEGDLCETTLKFIDYLTEE